MPKDFWSVDGNKLTILFLGNFSCLCQCTFAEKSKEINTAWNAGKVKVNGAIARNQIKIFYNISQ